jgi:prepilin-type processing-associated H-X9-DG protein
MVHSHQLLVRFFFIGYNEKNLQDQNPFMQCRLSTIFLVFFVTATSLAAFGERGLIIAPVVLAVAFLHYWKPSMTFTKVGVCLAILFVLMGLLMPAKQSSGDAVQLCHNGISEIGLALQNYHEAHKQFPPLITYDKNGNPLYSWLVEILPNIDCAPIYDRLNKDEPWNSPLNAQELGHRWIYQYKCPYAFKDEKNLSANFIAIIGPGTIWRSEKPMSLQDLPRSPELIVSAIECAVSDKHWAEPYILTAEVVLERMETGKGMRISSAHPLNGSVHVLFADGSVRSLSTEMPISMWRKLLLGEIGSLDELDNWKSSSVDPAPVNMWINQPPSWPSKLPFVLSIIIWLFSVALILHRAWEGRTVVKKQETPAG